MCCTPRIVPSDGHLHRKTTACADAWREIGASSEVLSWIEEGVGIDWVDGPPAPFHHGGCAVPPDAAGDWDALVSRLLLVGGLEYALDERFVSRAFLVPKKNGGWRLVVDLRWLNSHCVKQSVQYETLKSLRRFAMRNAWMVSFDLQDGYYHLAIKEEDRKYFTFCVNGKCYRCVGLPFGWTASPRIFTKLMRPVVQALRNMATPTPADGWSAHRKKRRRHTLRVLPYLDDFLLIAHTPAAAASAAFAAKQLLSSLGLSWNDSKCVWAPTQRLVHLGLEVDTRKGVFRVDDRRRNAIRNAARNLLCRASESARMVRVRDLAAFCGKAVSVQLAVLPARFYLRSLYDALITKTSWSSRVRLSHRAIKDLQWWAQLPQRWNGRPIELPSAEAELHVDSSSYGWGAIFNSLFHAHGLWPVDSPAHITLKELRAVRLALTSFRAHAADKCILVHEDNMAVVAALSGLCSRSPEMMAELRELWTLLTSERIELVCQYINTHVNPADPVSRIKRPEDYQLDGAVFARLSDRWGPHTIDRFAAAHNTLLPLWNSEMHEPGSAGVNAFAQADWGDHNNWCHPPVRLLPQLVQHLHCTGAAATVLVPNWPAQPWYAPLVELADDIVHLPPCSPSLLLTPFAPFPECKRWSMMAVRIFGAPTPAPRAAS
jgi:Reverse transcriptase (RNA-dependent DNA polymerase)